MMISTKTALALFSLVLCLGNLQAQETTETLVQEDELRACLELEQQGIERFNRLEATAINLRDSEKLLGEQRATLQKQQARLGPGNPGPESISRFNEEVNVFNSQADQFNANKLKFEQDSADYQSWMNSSLSPACSSISNKPVNPVTSYYACGLHTQSPLLAVPHCQSVPNIETLKVCIQNSASKSLALENCKD